MRARSRSPVLSLTVMLDDGVRQNGAEMRVRTWRRCSPKRCPSRSAPWRTGSNCACAADDGHEVVVVGGGIAGLTAAYALRDRDVLLLEADDRVGGRIYSEPRGDVWLNFGAHVFAGPESASGRLFEELGVEAAPVPAGSPRSA